jgi:hypothetical protein
VVLEHDARYGDTADVKLARPKNKQDARPAPPPARAMVRFDGSATSLKETGRPRKAEAPRRGK